MRVICPYFHIPSMELLTSRRGLISSSEVSEQNDVEILEASYLPSDEWMSFLELANFNLDNLNSSSNTDIFLENRTTACEAR